MSKDSFKKITLNLYADDVTEMEKVHGRGWSEVVRDLVRQHLINRRRTKEILSER